jgi:hypothetical protein
MRAFARLSREHRALAPLLSRVRAAGPEWPRDLARLRRDLQAHVDAEESVLYPSLRDSPATRHATLEALEESRILRSFLDRLTALDPNDPDWPSTLDALDQSLRRHVEEVEGPLFSRAVGALAADELAAIDARLDAERQSPVTREP